MTVRSRDRLEELKRELILSAEEDYMDLSSYANEVGDALGLRGEDETREYTFRLIAELLEDRYIRAGIPTATGGFEEWDEDLVEVVAHIDGEWRRLGRTPELGEIVWFEATDKGVSYVNDPSLVTR
jgi:hypothetical protein